MKLKVIQHQFSLTENLRLKSRNQAISVIHISHLEYCKLLLQHAVCYLFVFMYTFIYIYHCFRMVSYCVIILP